MWTIVIAMLVIVVLAGLVVVYVAFPHRGEDVPKASWLGDVMRKGVEVMPTLDNTEESAEPAETTGSTAPTAPTAPTGSTGEQERPRGRHVDDGSSPAAG
jgi:hypothetical protein